MHVSACMCESDYMPDTLRTFLDASELNHNGPLLLGAVKTTGGRGGEAWGGRKGRERWGKRGSKVQRGDVGEGGGERWRKRRTRSQEKLEEVRSQVGKTQELGRKEEGRKDASPVQKSAGQRGKP